MIADIKKENIEQLFATRCFPEGRKNRFMNFQYVIGTGIIALKLKSTHSLLKNRLFFGCLSFFYAQSG